MRIITATLTASLLLLGLGACGSSNTAVSARPGKYDQTWTTPYGSTTCDQFLTAMNDHQRWATAADMLTSARKVDGATSLPADAEVDRFEKDMATACQPIATAKTTDIGASIYMLDASYKP